MNRNRKKAQKVISSIFAFTLSMVFLFLFLVVGMYFGVFNERVILLKVNESNYYNEVHQEINEKAKSIINGSGLPDSVLDGVLTLERVYVGGKYYIEDTLAGREPSIKTDRVKEDLENNISQYLVQNGIIQTAELKTGIEEMITKVEQEYIREYDFNLLIIWQNIKQHLTAL